MTTLKEKELLTKLAREAAALAATEYCVETNEGTYGAAECCRKVGCGSPEFGNYSVYETVGGERRHVGCDKGRAPGRARHLEHDLAADRKRLAELRRQIREMSR